MEEGMAAGGPAGVGEQGQVEPAPQATPAGLAELGLAATGTVHEGGVSRVVQARAADGALHAVRLIRPELVDSAEVAAAFEEWARRAVAVRSEHLVAPTAVGRLQSAGGSHYLLMDWLEGRSLRHHLALRNQGMLPENAFHLIRQVAQGLGDLHAAGLAHGDVRAESVLLTRQGRALLLDVGITPILRRRAEDVRGVPWAGERHAPPERSGGDDHPTSASADVYQLGALTYEVFSGGIFSRWVPLEELSEMVDFLPVAMDELVQACLASPAERPADAAAFLARFVPVEEEFEENQRRGRKRDHGSTRQLWDRAVALAAGERPPWGYVAALCRRLLGLRPHLMPFGKVSERPVRELLEEAERRLRAGRREHLERMMQRGSWAVAAAFVDQLAEEVPAAEAEQLRVAVERGRLEAAGGRPEVLTQVTGRLLALLKAPELTSGARLEAVELLERVMQRGGQAAAASGRSMVMVAPTGELAPVEHWEVNGATWHVVLGASMRLGRGSWEEFRNHVDLRPTREEVEQSSSTLLLAQVLSRAGHLEFRAAREGIEAVCLGTHGATVDGEDLQRGEALTLAAEGSCRLAKGAVELRYRLWSGVQGEPLAFTVHFVDGLGRGRSAAWVLQRLPLQALHPTNLECGVLLPTPHGWEVEAWQDGVVLDDVAIVSGARRLWRRGETVHLPGGVSLRRVP